MIHIAQNSTCMTKTCLIGIGRIHVVSITPSLVAHITAAGLSLHVAQNQQGYTTNGWRA